MHLGGHVEQLNGKVAVVTGAASGIGLSLSRRFAAEGMRVVMADIEPDALAVAAGELRAGGAEVHLEVVDVSVGEDVDRLADAALEAFGAVHLVCNNAGVGGGGSLETLSTADWEWVLGVNLWGVIHGIRAFLPLLLAQGEGHIVNTASLAGLIAAPFMGPYNASKSAVVAISETAHAELAIAGTDVGVSVLCPAWVRTRIHESDRNRPESHRARSGAAQERDSAMAEVIAGLIENGLDPDDVAGQVLDAVRAKRFWVLTHPESREFVRARTDAAVGRPAAATALPPLSGGRRGPIDVR